MLIETNFSFSMLAFPTLMIFLGVFFISNYVLKNSSMAFVIAIIKSSIYYIFFAFFFNGDLFKDDLGYLLEGLELIKYVNDVPFRDFLVFAQTHLGSRHIFYPIINMITVGFFRGGYFAPVAINNIVLALVAALGSKLATQEWGFSDTNKKILYIALFLYPVHIGWAVFNAKDIWVLLFHIILLYGFAQLFRKRYIKSFFIIGFACIILYYLRYYAPWLFGLSFGITLLILIIQNKPKHRLLVICSLIVTPVILFPFLKPHIGTIQQYLGQEFNPVYGTLYFLLTPIPYAEFPFDFRALPSLIHWLLFPFMLLGIVQLWKTNKVFSRFMVIYFFVFVGFYALVSELRGDRQRIQLDFAIVLFQFLGLQSFFSWSFRKSPTSEIPAKL